MRKTMTLALTAVTVCVAVGTMIANGATDPNLTVAGAITQVKTTYGENLVGTATLAWVDVAKVRMAVPAGKKALFVARLDANAYCEAVTPGVGDGSCQLRIVAKSGTKTLALRPTTMIEALEVESGVNEEDYSLMMEKSRVLPTGTWTIVAQHRVTDTSVYFGIYGHHLTVERAFV